MLTLDRSRRTSGRPSFGSFDWSRWTWGRPSFGSLGWSRWTWGRPPCGEHSRARKACARKRSPPGARQIAGAIWLGRCCLDLAPHCRDTPPALRHGAPWCLAITVSGRRVLVRVKGSTPCFFVDEKCRSVGRGEAARAFAYARLKQPLRTQRDRSPRRSRRRWVVSASGVSKCPQQVWTRSLVSLAHARTRF